MSTEDEIMFEIGKVLFLIGKKNNKIFPVQVAECVIRKTLKGESCEHTVIIPNRDQSKMKLEEMDVEIFTTPQEAHDYMNRNALAAIAGMIETAVDLATEAFGTQEEEPEQQIMPLTDSDSPESFVDLGNGMRARVRFDGENQ